MYYINCVCTVIDYNDGNIQRYRNYSNWANMSDEEDWLIFVLGLALAPNEWEGKVFFNRPDLCPEASNEFYEIGEVRNEFFVVQSIVIGGQQRRVKNIMTYKQSWMENNFYEPIRNLTFRFSPAGQRQEAIQRAMISQACVIS
jgi:hypothetical protein